MLTAGRYEPLAIQFMEKYLQQKIEGFGLLTHDHYPWLGASVDGVTSNGTIVEIKCPYRSGQVQIQMEVLAIPKAIVAKFEYFEVPDLQKFEEDEMALTKGVLFESDSSSSPGESPPEPIYSPEDIAGDGAALISWMEETRNSRPDLIPRLWSLETFTNHSFERDQEWFQRILPFLQKGLEELQRQRERWEKEVGSKDEVRAPEHDEQNTQ
ncbi:hypothetical protein HK104_010366 [Borealophlyctis nickersoniae]|nr:hypothetical protein HK104_010366 [Borealophlyctis nickersoniae]